MNEIRSTTVNIREYNISRPEDEELFVRERPIETIARRIEELSLSLENVSYLLDTPVKIIEDSLAEEIYCPEGLFNKLLRLVGMEIVAVPDLCEWREDNGHWYFFERCVYCNANMYDVGMTASVHCEVNGAQDS